MTGTLLLALMLSATPPELAHFTGGSIQASFGQKPADVSNGWSAYRTDALYGRADLCCWQSWHAGQPANRGCELSEQDGHWYSRGAGDNTSGRDPRRRQILVLTRQVDAIAQRILTVGSDCPINLGEENLVWLGYQDATLSADWLDSMVNPARRRLSSEALQALAAHAGGRIESRLAAHARSKHTGLASDAIFWLGEARGAPGLRELDLLLEELPHGKTRRQINFALAQNQSEAAADRLASIADEDASERQRADALLWLARSYPDKAVPALNHALIEAKSKKLVEAALHGLSELDTAPGSQSLKDVAGTHPDMDIRGKAMFWLAQGYPDIAVDFLDSVLGNAPPGSLVEAAVFALSQIPAPDSTNALLKLVSNDAYAKPIRRQALFWLAQSNDPKATDALAKLLHRSWDR